MSETAQTQEAPAAAPPIRVLLVEPDPGEAERLRAALAPGGRFEIATAPRLETALALLGGPVYDVVLLSMACGDGEVSPVRRIRELSRIPVVCLAARSEAELALEALRQGAQDCLAREEAGAAILVRTLLHAVERERLVGELRSSRERERYLATHDALTGLPNRRAFEARLHRAVEAASQRDVSGAVFFIGLDRFRHVNDSVGHTAGDAVLVQASRRLARCLRRGDLLARVNGDEFVVLIDRIQRARDAVTVAEKIEQALEPAYLVEGREYWVGPSIGIAVFPRDGDDPDWLLRSAYSAMREVKSEGGAGHRFFRSSMNDTARRRMQIETRLRRALERGELQLHYQPKVETVSGKIVGAEALLRWTDQELGEVEPKTVIPLAEETGLIADIGEWSLRTACAQNAEWNRGGFGPLRMSVNLSPRQITDEGIREAVVRALWDTGLEPDLLELEITESSLMANEDVAIRLLEDLKQVGVAVSLDDFGTGFSSLSYLKRFPVDILKIDQSFVRDIALDPDDAAIVGAIISIAQNLDLGVIAEGVETEEQRAFLRARGCPEMQGFLMSPAVPAERFTKMLEKQARR